MMRILVTGGAGFIGSHTVDFLLEQELAVTVFDNFVSGRADYLNLSHPNLTLVTGDVLDYSQLSAEIKKADAVLHLAALPSVPKSIEDPVTSCAVNTQGFLHVLQAIRESKRAIRLVYASSAAVYGKVDTLPCRDDLPLLSEPLSPYALEKTNNERYADLYARLFGIKSIGLRYFNVYGERQDPNSPYSGVISKFIQCYQENKPITIFGDGEQSRDFIYVKDVAKANWLALQADYTGVLNIATGVPETLQNLIRYIEQTGQHPAKLQFEGARLGDIPHSYAKTTEADFFLGFCYTTALQEGIRLLLLA
ncbi:MAG: UDP-glucose 4-epimerase [uncultured bacterium]|nr:MAG: UDP-glucose 4-epimerase [uncultured bacterium]